MLPHADVSERDARACGKVAGTLIGEAIMLLARGIAPNPVAFERKEGPTGPFTLINNVDEPVDAAAYFTEWFASVQGWDPGIVDVDVEGGQIIVEIPDQRGEGGAAVTLLMRFRVVDGRLKTTNFLSRCKTDVRSFANDVVEGIGIGIREHPDSDSILQAFCADGDYYEGEPG